jgi:hypothetical protein
MKLAFIKIFVKMTDKEREDFAYLRKKIAKISEAKMKEGIFVGPQIKQLFEDQDCSTKSDATDRRAGRHLKTSERPFQAMEKWKITVALCRTQLHQTVLWVVSCH